MKVEVKKLDAIKRELKFEVSKERVAKTLDEIYQDLGKYANIKGFRPGKAPRHILETQHGKLAQEETLKKIIPEVYQEALEKEKLLPLDMPEIEDVNFKDGKITFKASIEVKPEVTIKDYKGIKVTRKSVTVTDEEINKTLDYFKQGQGKDKEIVIDDTFAKGLGYPTLEEFKNTLKRQMEIDKDRMNKMEVENQVIDSLLKKAKLTTPTTLVARQYDKRLEEIKSRMKSQGMKEEDMKKKVESLEKNLKEQVEKDVKTYLVLDKIAELEKIELKENEHLPVKVMEFLLKEANWEEAK